MNTDSAGAPGTAVPVIFAYLQYVLYIFAEYHVELFYNIRNISWVL